MCTAEAGEAAKRCIDTTGTLPCRRSAAAAGPSSSAASAASAVRMSAPAPLSKEGERSYLMGRPPRMTHSMRMRTCTRTRSPHTLFRAAEVEAHIITRILFRQHLLPGAASARPAQQRAPAGARQGRALSDGVVPLPLLHHRPRHHLCQHAPPPHRHQPGLGQHDLQGAPERAILCTTRSMPTRRPPPTSAPARPHRRRPSPDSASMASPARLRLGARLA